MDWPICIIDDKAEAELYKSFFGNGEFPARSTFIKRGWIEPDVDRNPFGVGILWRWANIPATRNIYYKQQREQINNDTRYE